MLFLVFLLLFTTTIFITGCEHVKGDNSKRFIEPEDKVNHSQELQQLIDETKVS